MTAEGGQEKDYAEPPEKAAGENAFNAYRLENGTAEASQERDCFELQDTQIREGAGELKPSASFHHTDEERNGSEETSGQLHSELADFLNIRQKGC